MPGSDWIDKRMAERKRRLECERLIADDAEGIFEKLWEEVKHWVEEAKRKGFPISINGSPYERVIKQSNTAFPNSLSTPPKTLHITLEKGIIEIIGSEASFTFLLEVGEDNVVCLKLSGKKFSIRDAAIVILDSFLFPDCSPGIF